MNTSNLLVCDMCKRTVYRGDTLIVESPKGRLRLCRDCQLEYYLDEMKSKHPGMNINLKQLGVNKSDLFSGAERQFRRIKEGA